MGTSIQRYELGAEDFGGARLEGCNDYLVISRPDVIEEIHASFLEVGCDVVETDTFRSNRLTLGEYGLRRAGAGDQPAPPRAWRGSVADRFSTPERPRFVAGSIGPSRLPALLLRPHPGQRHLRRAGAGLRRAGRGRWWRAGWTCC